jgi:hypothetical protein
MTVILLPMAREPDLLLLRMLFRNGRNIAEPLLNGSRNAELRVRTQLFNESSRFGISLKLERLFRAFS